MIYVTSLSAISFEVAAIMVADKPCGIDIEKIYPAFSVLRPNLSYLKTCPGSDQAQTTMIIYIRYGVQKRLCSRHMAWAA